MRDDTLPGTTIHTVEKTCECVYERQYHEENGEKHFVNIWHCTLCGSLTEKEPPGA